MVYGMISSSNNLLGLDEWAGVIVLAIIGLLVIGISATCGLVNVPV